jgi:biopolymer transport protein TolR
MGASIQISNHTNRRRGKRSQRAPMAEINVTPFVDVMLVLLIIFMVTARFMTAGVSIELPKTGAPALAEQEKQEPLTLTVNESGQIFLQETEVAVDEIGPKLAAIAKGSFDQAIYVRGDRRANYGTLMKVMAKISGAGFKRISLVTDSDERN